MARVLVSFLGTGPYEEKGGERKYREATYKIENKEYVTPFISAALVRHLRIDKKIIIGTAKSMWEEYYRYFYEHSRNYDSNLYSELIDFCGSANFKTTDFSLLNELENKMPDSKVIVLKYGLDEQEMRDNITSVLHIDNYLDKKDKLFIDVTHGFRSFPLLAQQVVFYLKEVSSKNIKPQSFYYGMLESSRELGYAPIIDLNIMLEMNEWLLGANQLKTSSNADKIGKLLKQKDESLMLMMDSFSKALNINYIPEIEKQLSELSRFDSSNLNNPEKLIVEKVINEFVTHFGGIEKHSKFQFELARWYYSKNNFSSAYIVLSESVVTLICEQNGFSTTDKKDRDKAKLMIDKREEFKYMYKNISNIRNNIAHSLSNRPDACNIDITEFNKYIKRLKPFFK